MTVPFAAGSGVSGDPYMVETAAQLHDIRNYAGAHFALGCDIDLEAQGIGNWVPIDQPNLTLDGFGFTILGFNCYDTTKPLGFFGTVGNNPMTVKRLNLLGGVVGVAGSSTYYTSYLIGQQAGSAQITVEDVMVSGKLDTGGDRGNGLIGIIQTSAVTIRRTVSDVSSKAPGRGGDFYVYTGSPTRASNYYNNDTCTVSSTAYVDGTALTRAQMLLESSFTGLDFTNVWEMVDGRPRVRKVRSRAVSGPVYGDTGQGAVRKVRVYSRASGQLLGEATSAADGTYSVPLGAKGPVDVQFMDDDAGIQYNNIIVARVTPG